ncbi:MAG TPA: PIG-L family deacetylase [Ktedonobacteraceae bacterium]|nr:PIG-L family deacetylase [Ktedonobacteraceae bacterium]
MSQVQHVVSQPSQLRESRAMSWQESLQQYEATLLAELFRRNGRKVALRTATPPGYRYRSEDGGVAVPVDGRGPVMQIAAHPGDGPDFFYATYLKMVAHTQYTSTYHEVLLTDGEGGVDAWSPEQTRQVRVTEAYASAEIVGSKLHFLGYPDGGLAILPRKEREQLVRELAELLRDIQPRILIVHPPKNDHPDHAYSFLLTLAALERNAQAGREKPALFMHDVEFGLQQESLWVASALDAQVCRYPMHVPGMLVDISFTHQDAQHALHLHRTQMRDPVSGQPKAYADLIDTLARVRGLQFMTEGARQFPYGQGFSHVVIPGVTSAQNMLMLCLPEGSVYTRIRRER